MSRESYKNTNEHFRQLSIALLDGFPREVRLYFNHFDGSVLPKTMYGYLTDLQDFFRFLCHANPNITSIVEINDSTLNKLTTWDYDEYLSDVRSRQGEAAITRKISALRKYFNFLLTNKDFDFNNVDFMNMKRPKKAKKNTVVKMNGDEVKNFLDNVEFGTGLQKEALPYHKRLETRDMAILSLMLGTGIRISECIGLDLDDVDLDRNSIFLVRKGYHEERVFYSDEVKTYLAEYMEKRKKMDGIREGDEKALFISRQKKRISDDAVRNLVKKYSAGINKHITPHKLRSTYGGALYDATRDIYTVQEVLGHSSSETTRIYVGESESRRAEAAKIDIYNNMETK